MKLALFCSADALMILAAVVYGWKFIRKHNYLLGIEWLVMAISGTNFLVWSLTHSDTLYTIAFFFDAFSRAFGFPVVAVAGLMKVTHDYTPSHLAEVLYFVLGAGGAVALIAADSYPALAAYKPAFYVVMWVIFTVYLLYFAMRLFNAGEKGHALGVLLVAATGQAIATIYDYFPIPGDDAEHTLFYIAALSIWAFMLYELYHAYCALERTTRSTAQTAAGVAHSPA